jgi:hypothetical protein
MQEMDLPDPEAVLADPGSFALPHRSDRAYAAVAAVAAVVAARPTPERWAAGWRVLGIAARRAPDVAAVGARTLARCRPDGVPLRRGAAVRPGAARGRAAGRMSEIPGVATARLWAASRFRYLASAVFGVQPRPAPGAGTVAVDESWRL